MNNQQITDPSLVNIQSELTNEDSNNKNKIIFYKDMDILILSPSLIWKNVIILCSCLVAFIFLFWVYYKWMSIPIKRHNIQVEHLTSADSSANICANVLINDIKCIGSNNKMRLIDKEQKIIHSLYNYNNTYNASYNFNYTYYSNEYKHTYPKKNNFTGSISDIIGKDLYDELNDTCQNYNLDIREFHGLFYFRHLDNEKYGKKRVSKHQISVTENPFYINSQMNPTITIYGFNDISLENYQRDSAFSIFPDEFNKDKIINNTTIVSRGYKNVTEGYVLCKKEKDLPYNLYTNTNFFTPNKLSFFFVKVFFQMEDISQSYYEIELTSKTIPEMSLKLNFSGTINCIPDSSYAGPFVNHNIEIDRSIVTIKTSPSKNRHLFLVKFNDMENMQTMRLFILAALITLTLTNIIKTLRNIYVIGSTKFKWKKHHSRKKKS